MPFFALADVTVSVPTHVPFHEGFHRGRNVIADIRIYNRRDAAPGAAENGYRWTIGEAAPSAAIFLPAVRP